MKKALLLALSLTLTVSALVGCAQQAESASSSTVSASVQPPTQSSLSGEEMPEPIYPQQLVNGSYEITVDSSASMFRVVKCVLSVEDDRMTATMTMSGQGYGMVYLGTREEADQDSLDTYIPFVLDEAGAKTFTVPVEALDLEMDCAAWSIRKEKWYDRVLVFESEGLPAEAFQMG